ncbi:MAG: hypothetical protein H0T11_05415 [Chthoniobacterales bacterium]|nr:hypothetical protein [Chthoniobacterales bacterium]
MTKLPRLVAPGRPREGYGCSRTVRGGRTPIRQRRLVHGCASQYCKSTVFEAATED